MLSRRICGFVPVLKSAQKNRINVPLNKRKNTAFFFSSSNRPGAQKMEFKT